MATGSTEIRVFTITPFDICKFSIVTHQLHYSALLSTQFITLLFSLVGWHVSVYTFVYLLYFCCTQSPGPHHISITAIILVDLLSITQAYKHHTHCNSTTINPHYSTICLILTPTVFLTHPIFTLHFSLSRSLLPHSIFCTDSILRSSTSCLSISFRCLQSLITGSCYPELVHLHRFAFYSYHTPSIQQCSNDAF